MSKIKSSMEKSAKCPFFHDGGGVTILCEGALHNSQVRQVFNCKEDRLLWAKSHCNNIKKYSECPIYQYANKKYNE